MDLGLNGKVAIITGAGSQIGYGKAVALTLAREGCDIVTADIDLEGAKKTAAEVEALGCKAMAVKVNVANRAEVDDMVKAALDKFGKIDILVNNAGTSSDMQPFVNMTKADWDIDIGVNLYGQMNVAQSVLPHMMSRKYGRIINFSGGQGIPTIAVYGAAKAGIEAWTRALAKEVASSGVIVNGVGPGLAETGLVSPKASSEFKEIYRRMSALKRLCTTEDIGPVVAFLASDVCSYMVGQFIRLEA